MIVVAGEALVDLIPNADGDLSVNVGGGPLNAARWLARLGSDVCFLGAVAQDPLGLRIRQSLADCGVSLELLIETSAPTTLALAQLDAAGTASYSFYVEGTSATQVEVAQVASAPSVGLQALHLGGLGLLLEPVGTALEALTLHAHTGGALVMLDPNIRPSLIRERERYLERLRRVLRRTQVVKLSVEDAAWIAPDGEPLEVAKSLLALGPDVVLLTAGVDGAHVVAGASVVHVPAQSVEVIDTIGAGDAFSAGFLRFWCGQGNGPAQLSDIEALGEAARFATRLAALACAQRGATPPLSINGR